MRTTKRHGVNDAMVRNMTRLNIRIDATVYQRLMITCVMSKRAPGDIVGELIEKNLREFRVQRNTTARDGSSDRQSEVTGGIEMAAEAA